MYVETTITSKDRALYNASLGFLFWEDLEGKKHRASVGKVKSGWHIFRFFTCSHANPSWLED